MSCIYAIPVSNMSLVGDVIKFDDESACVDFCKLWSRYVSMLCYQGSMSKYLQDNNSIEYLPINKKWMDLMFGINADDLQ